VFDSAKQTPFKEIQMLNLNQNLTRDNHESILLAWLEENPDKLPEGGTPNEAIILLRSTSDLIDWVLADLLEEEIDLPALLEMIAEHFTCYRFENGTSVRINDRPYFTSDPF
jgi:hypothetical protein